MTTGAPALFGRVIVLRFVPASGGRALRLEASLSSPLSVEVTGERTGGRKPGKATIKITNLSADTRAAIKAADMKVEVEAGYTGAGFGRLFSGDVDTVTVARPNATDIVTTVEARDGGAAYSERAMAEAWLPPIDSGQVLRRLAAAAGLGLSRLHADLPVVTYPAGYRAEGRPRDLLDGVCDGLDASWSIQDGELVVVPRGGALPGRAVLLSPSSGLLGSPEEEKKKGRAAGLKVKALFQPALVLPGRLVQVESAEHKGTYKIKAASFSLSSRGQAFTVDLTLAAAQEGR
jgi:hypothetical protein